MTRGWRGQLDRVRRWHARIVNAPTPADESDFLYAFFENALHLRDWLLDTGAVSKATMQALFDGHVEMRLCRDLANAHKHYSLRDPSQPEPPSEAREYVPADGSRGPGSRLVVLSEWEKYEPVRLASDILAIWEEFIEREVAT